MLLNQKQMKKTRTVYSLSNRNSLSKEVEVLKLVIKNLTRDYEACQE